MTADTENEEKELSVLLAASRAAGLDARGAELIRRGENVLWRLPGKIVARIARPGQIDAATKEVAVARWLAGNGIPAVRPVPDLCQPFLVNGQPVTFWQELPRHVMGEVADVAALVRQVHQLKPPNHFKLPRLAPFIRLTSRIENATTFSESDRAWLLARTTELAERYDSVPSGLPWGVVHGDAWRGNVARATTGAIFLLDFERTAFGPPEWDLVSTAVSHVSTGWLGSDSWHSYCDAYGYDVTEWSGFTLLRDIRELRMTTMAAQVAAREPSKRNLDQAARRLACIRGCAGARPWSGWHQVP